MFYKTPIFKTQTDIIQTNSHILSELLMAE
jgi:hypothetical protein